MNLKINQLNFEKLNGLIPAVIVDPKTDNVLMLGFMNEEALIKTIDTKLVTFFSRTKNRLWTKGETSKNYLHLIDIKIDCDNDSLLIYVNPDGPTCHTGNYSCFEGVDQSSSISFLNELFSSKFKSFQIFSSKINCNKRRISSPAASTIRAPT